MASEVSWKGLHPVSLLVNLVPRTWQTIRSSWWLLAAAFFGVGRVGPSDGLVFIDLGFVILFFLIAIGNTVVHFLTLRYRVAGGRLEMKSGILNRQVRVISAERIQNVEMVRNIFHRLSGMVEVRIETASGTEVEGLLSALSVDEARALIRELDEAREDAPRVASETQEEAPPFHRNSALDLAWYGITSTQLSGVAVAIGLILEGLTLGTEPSDQVARTTGLFAGLGGLALLLALVTGAWLVGTISAVVRHYGFRLSRNDQALVAQQGLLTSRRAVLRLRKVQLVTIVEPVLRRLAGFASVGIETAAAREGGDGTQRSEAMVPYVAQRDVPTVVGAAVPLGDLVPAEASLQPPHPRALVRAIAASVTRSAILAGVLTWWLFPYGLMAWLLVPIGVYSAWLDHRHQGWLLTDDLLISRRGWFNRRTWLLARKKIQSTIVAQGPISRRYDLGVVQVRVAGNAVELPAMAWGDALELQARLLRERST